MLSYIQHCEKSHQVPPDAGIRQRVKIWDHSSIAPLLCVDAIQGDRWPPPTPKVSHVRKPRCGKYEMFSSVSITQRPSVQTNNLPDVTSFVTGTELTAAILVTSFTHDRDRESVREAPTLCGPQKACWWPDA